ncbi:MAG: hypothetical protein SVR08_10485 [Spirochaetota bacterium]|nr:hypothetical protein [Spirochaetota bacterium]
MTTYDRYYKCIVRSVDHIFKSFFNDPSIAEVYEIQARNKFHNVSIELDGTLCGELIIRLPNQTLNSFIKKLVPGVESRSLRKYQADVAGEVANLITSSFVNQLQFINHSIILSPPDFNDDPIQLKTLYENINVSFSSDLGGFDVDLYYKRG